jgi:hypothetical protein
MSRKSDVIIGADIISVNKLPFTVATVNAEGGDVNNIGASPANENNEIIEGNEAPDEAHDEAPDDNDDKAPDDNNDKAPDNSDDAKYGARSGRYDLRPRKPRDYSHLHATLEHTVLTQYSLRCGIAKFGDEAVTAVLKELIQLHDRGGIEPKQAHVLTREEKRAALQYLMFLKRKRIGTLQGRECADGCKQRLHSTKEEASSPTVAIESVFVMHDRCY